MCEETVGKNFQEIHSLLWLSNGSFGVNAPKLKPKNQKTVDFFFLHYSWWKLENPERNLLGRRENMQIPYWEVQGWNQTHNHSTVRWLCELQHHVLNTPLTFLQIFTLPPWQRRQDGILIWSHVTFTGRHCPSPARVAADWVWLMSGISCCLLLQIAHPLTTCCPDRSKTQSWSSFAWTHNFSVCFRASECDSAGTTADLPASRLAAGSNWRRRSGGKRHLPRFRYNLFVYNLLPWHSCSCIMGSICNLSFFSLFFQ